jgi:hypothetical protein
MPLPGGGVLVSHRDTISAFSSQGKLLWDEEMKGYLKSWTEAEEWVIFITSDDQVPLLMANADGLSHWADGLSGIPIVGGDRAWLYAEDGLYRLDLTTRTMQRTFVLPPAKLSRSTAYSLSDGSLILLHTDAADRRLLLFNSDGELEWEFSIPFEGTLLLLELAGEIYLAIQPTFATKGTFKAIEIFSVDPEKEILTRIFEGGSRAFNPRTTWVSPVNDQGLLIHMDGTGSIYLNPIASLAQMGK